MNGTDSEKTKELMRQQEEAVEIGRVMRTLTNDMCRSRHVNYSFASGELISHGLSMLRLFHHSAHQGIIEEHGPDGIRDFDSVFSSIALGEFLSFGSRISDNDSNPSVFGLLSGDLLTNEKFAQSLYLINGLSVESVSSSSFRAGRDGECFKIWVSVHDDAISFFTYHDEPNQSIEDNALACAKYNSQTNYSKAHIVNSDEFQIHFTYIFPHSGSVFVSDIKNILLEFIDENVRFSQDIW